MYVFLNIRTQQTKPFFFAAKSYNVRMDGERPVVAAPAANASPQSNNFFKCPKKVWTHTAVLKIYSVLHKKNNTQLQFGLTTECNLHAH